MNVNVFSSSSYEQEILGVFINEMIKEEAACPVSPHPHPVPQLSRKIWRVLWGKIPGQTRKRKK